MTKNQKNVLKWTIGVFALILGGYCIIKLTPDPQNPLNEPTLGIGWVIGGLVIACAMGGWYVKQVLFGETKNDTKDGTVEEETKPEGDGGIEVEA